jgi:hypothetical protein
MVIRNRRDSKEVLFPYMKKYLKAVRNQSLAQVTASGKPDATCATES